MLKNDYGFPRKTSWERVFLYWPIIIDNKFYWWRWAERRAVIDWNYEGRTVGYFEWRVCDGI